MRIALATLTLLVLAGGLPAQEARPAYLGVRAATLNAETRANFPYVPADVTSGVVLSEILPDTAAARASLKGGDVLIKLGGQAITSAEDLRAVLSKKHAGDSIDYVVRRGAGTISGRLKLGTRPVTAEDAPRPAVAPKPPPAVKPAKKEGADVDARLERIRKEMDDLRAKALERRSKTKRPLRRPRSIGGWLMQERQGLAAARKARKAARTPILEREAVEKMRYHAARIALLEEMQAANTPLPNQRLNRMEKKLDEVLRRLGQRQLRGVEKRK